MTNEEFKKIAEKTLKRIPDIEDNIELCEITLDEENQLIQFLLSTNDLQSSWNIGQDIVAKGYCNGIPFIVYPNNEKSGVLVIGNSVVKYYNHNQSYEEYLYDGDITTHLSKSNTPGRFNEKSIAVEHESSGVYISYCETQYSNYATIHESIASVNDEVNRVFNDLVAKKHIQNDYVYTDGDYKSYHLDKALLESGEGKREIARLSTTYSSSARCLLRQSPQLISIKEKSKKSARHFILISTGLYIDTNLYLEEGFDAALIAKEEIETILNKNGLSLEACERLEDWINNDEIPTKVVQAVVNATNKLRKDSFTRTLKNN